MTVTSQKTAPATPARWARLYGTGYLLVILQSCHLRGSLFLYVCLQCPPNVHKMDGYTCEKDQVRIFGLVWFPKSLYLCRGEELWHDVSPCRGAALTAGVKPKTGSANTSGERVSANPSLPALNYRGEAAFPNPNGLVVSVRGNGSWQVLLREVKHRRHGERQLWEGQGHLDPVQQTVRLSLL